MVPANHFRYLDSLRLTSRPFRLTPDSFPAVGSSDFRRRMAEVGAALGQQQVATVYLLHGCPGGGEFSESYARWFESALRGPGQARIPVRLFEWSGENSHLGRADGAIRLLDELNGLELAPGQRVLLWGHSDAADVLALAGRLLTSGPESAGRFFRAAEIYYRWPIFGCIDVPVWNHVRCRLERGAMLEGVFLDLVTFGASGRYGWGHSARCRHLHFVSNDAAVTQQSEAIPTRSAWRARLADRRLQRFFDFVFENEGPEPAETIRASTTTLLVDYGRPWLVPEQAESTSQYTREEWLLFHAEEVARRFYTTPSLKVA